MDRLRLIFDWISERKLFTSIFLALVLAAVLTMRFLIDSYSGQESEPIAKGKIVDAVYGIGTVTPVRRLSMNPLVGTTVAKTLVMEGDRVKKGQALLQTNEGVTYRAPFDGIVNYSPYRNGENTYPTTPMLIVTDMSDRYVLVSMEQQGALRVKVGQVAKISFDSIRQTVYEGKVSAVYSYNSSFLARIDGVSLPDSILPEMTCDVAIVIGEHQNATLIPVVAFDSGQVWVKKAGHIPHPVPVKIGVTDGIMAEVLDGDIVPGDRVLIRKQVGR